MELRRHQAMRLHLALAPLFVCLLPAMAGPGDGEEPRPMLGIALAPLTAEVRAARGVPGSDGALVADVVRHSSAWQAGLRPGDVVLRVGPRALSTTAEVGELMAKKRVGQELSLMVWRDGRRVSLSCTLLPRPRPGAFERWVEHGGRQIVAVELAVSVEPDASPEWLAATHAHFVKAAEQLYTSTWGNMAIVKITITDRETTKDGDVVLENLNGTMCTSWKGVYGWWDEEKRLRLGGRFLVLTFVHEWGHVKFGLPEEYDDNTCPCYQSTNDTIRYYWCTAENHVGAGRSCWERICQVYPTWTFPDRSAIAPMPAVAAFTNDR